MQLPHLFVLPLQLADAGLGLLAGGSVRVQRALAPGGVQDHGAAVAVVQKIPAHLHDSRDIHCPAMMAAWLWPLPSAVMMPKIMPEGTLNRSVGISRSAARITG